MAPNNYISTYSGDFGGRKSKSFSFTGGKQGPSLVARQGKDFSGFWKNSLPKQVLTPIMLSTDLSSNSLFYLMSGFGDVSNLDKSN